MRLEDLEKLSGAFSWSMALIALILMFLFTSCNHMGISVDWCISDPDSGGVYCNTVDDENVFIPYEGTQNYSCLSPSDTERLISYLAKRCDNGMN